MPRHIFKDLRVVPCNKAQLKEYAEDIQLESSDMVVLKQKEKSRNWLLFINGMLVQELRSARAMSFMDGWLASARYNKTLDGSQLNQ